jgi:hypothetical protein
MTYEGPSGPAFGNVLPAKQLSGIFQSGADKKATGEM